MTPWRRRAHIVLALASAPTLLVLAYVARSWMFGWTLVDPRAWGILALVALATTFFLLRRALRTPRPVTALFVLALLAATPLAFLPPTGLDMGAAAKAVPVVEGGSRVVVASSMYSSSLTPYVTHAVYAFPADVEADDLLLRERALLAGRGWHVGDPRARAPGEAPVSFTAWRHGHEVTVSVGRGEGLPWAVPPDAVVLTVALRAAAS